MTKPPEFIAPENYKPLLPKNQQKAALAALRSSATLAKASRVIAQKTAALRGAVLDLVTQMEAFTKSGDWPAAFAAAHEIRGLAGTAGLSATGRIANGFCHYLDALLRAGAQPDAAIVQLHVDAITRSARTEDETARHGDAVADELAALVARRLAELRNG
jgi:hypothetical protein